MPLAQLPKNQFDIDCQRCKRLAKFLKEVKGENPDYFCKPVPPFGTKQPRLLIVGLAPGMHGANATGRPFTGDYAGVLLYETLHKFGFATRAESVAADDGLKLKQCRITNAVKCLPPANKPTGTEINTCNAFLGEELAALRNGTVVLALGGIAHNAVLKALGLKLKEYPFGHGHRYKLPQGITLATSYHCSRYNTQTKRLTEKMFHDVFRQIRRDIERK